MNRRELLKLGLATLVSRNYSNKNLAGNLFFYDHEKNMGDDQMSYMMRGVEENFENAGIRFTDIAHATTFPELRGLDMLLYILDHKIFETFYHEHNDLGYYSLGIIETVDEIPVDRFPIAQKEIEFPYNRTTSINNTGFITTPARLADVIKRAYDFEPTEEELLNATITLASHEAGHGLGAVDLREWHETSFIDKLVGSKAPYVLSFGIFTKRVGFHSTNEKAMQEFIEEVGSETDPLVISQIRARYTSRMTLINN